MTRESDKETHKSGGPISKEKSDLSVETVDLSGKSDRAPKGSSGSGSLPPLDAGSDFAGYRIVRKIAQGAMGVVYLAEDTTLDRKVAIKVILTAPGMQATEEQVNRFLREARSIAQLRHKRIVPVYEVDTFENCQYFAMEFIEGPTLEQYMLKNEVTAAKAIEIVLAIAEGLQEAHSKNIVHRDIKPANIIMQNSESPMITDFGLAKILEHEQKLTMTGSMLGTPCYMSPEQARGDADLDQRSDIFSLGVLLYEMVTEKLPFKGESYMKTALKVIEGNYILPRKIKPRLSRDVESIVKKALEKDREFRYQNMQDFIDDCLRFQRGEVVMISKSGIYRKVYRNIIKQRNSIIMSIMIILIIGYLMMRNIDQSQAVSDQMQISERQSREKEQASREKDQISKEKKQLELQGELLKRGSTSPEFAERFDNEKFFLNNWFTSWSPVIVKKGTAEIPSGKNLIMTPKIEGFSSSAIFSWKIKIPQGNRIFFFCGKPGQPDTKIIEKPVVISFQMLRVNDKAPDKDSRRKLKILFYQLPSKNILDRMNFNVSELLSQISPIAVRVVELPENLPESVYFSVKRHETFYEISIKEKEGLLLENETSFQKTYRVSSPAYLNPSPLQCGFYVPESNKFSMEIERFRVDKWLAGSSEIEINRIIESGWRGDYKLLVSFLQKHQEQLDLAISVAENQAEIATLKYQFAKTSFIKGVVCHRNLNYLGNKDDAKIIADSYVKTLEITQEYLNQNEKSSKTEFLNYEDLYLSVLVQTIFLNIYSGDFTKAIEPLKKYQEYTNDQTPYRNWFWNLSDPVEKWVNQIRITNRPKLQEKLGELHSFLRNLNFNAETGEASDIRRMIKDHIRNAVEFPDLDLFEKFNSLVIDESNKLFLTDLISKEVNKEKISGLFLLNVLKSYNKIFKVDEAAVVGNYKYERWSTIYPDRENKNWNEYCEFLKSTVLIQKVTKAYPEFGTTFNSSIESGVEVFNNLIENDGFRKKLLNNVLDDLLYESRAKVSGGIQAPGEVFPINLSFDQNRGGNININLEDDGIKIRIITKDQELRNRLSGNMVNQEDCWDLFFDFRQGNAFLSNQPGVGAFKVSYLPAAGETNEARLIFNEDTVAPKFKVLNYNNINRIIQQNEVILFLSFAEINKLTGASNLRYFGFNAVLNLESGDKSDLRILFAQFNKKVFSANKAAISAPEILISDKDLVNELTNVYQQSGDAFQDKVMVKKIFDNWLGITNAKPLINDIQFEKICADINATITDDLKRGSVKKIIDNASVVFSTYSVFQGMNNQSEVREGLAKNITEKVLSCLEANLVALEKKTKSPNILDGEVFFEEVKRARLFLKYTDGNGRKFYYRFLERLLLFYKDNQADFYETAHAYLMQVADYEYSAREKTIAAMLHGMTSESLFNLKKHLESDYWKDDERVWFEYQLLSKLAGNVDIKVSDETAREFNNHFGSLNRNLEVDCGLVLDKKMKLKEFNAKYPLAENYQNLLANILNDIPSNRKVDELKTGYENFLKVASSPWLASMIKKRINDLHK